MVRKLGRRGPTSSADGDDDPDPSEGGAPRGWFARRPRWQRLPILVVLLMLLMIPVPALVARVYEIPSPSMEQTLHGCAGCTNDRIVVDRLVYRFSTPVPGEVIVFSLDRGEWSQAEVPSSGTSNPLIAALRNLGSVVGIQPPNDTDFVKRVIAVGGQTVSCCDERNRVVVDGNPLDEPYIYFSPAAGSAQQEAFEPITVPEGELFVMGDNRNNSIDSRAPGNGPISVEDVVGKARFIVLPLSRSEVLDHPNPQTTQPGSTVAVPTSR